MKSIRRSRRLGTGPLLAAVAAAALSPAPAAGQPSAAAVAAPVLQVGPHEQGIARRLDLSIGRSIVVELPRDAKEVFVANPKVANAVVRSTRKLFVIGMENGATSIFVMDADGRQIAGLEVTVGRDLNVLRQTLRSALPSAPIEVRPAGDSILLTGLVASAMEAQQAVDIANAFVGTSGGLFTSAKGAVINSLTIKGKDQVMLRVTVVEVARNVLKQFGISTNGTWSNLSSRGQGSIDLANLNPFPLGGTPASGITASIARSGLFADATLRAFERAGVSRVLAEPTLTAISGESAKFTAGGEIPVPKSEDCDPTTRRCTIGVEFKPYGVTLNFTPVVLSEGRISMRVGTEVTEIDPDNSIRIGGIAVPGMKVRKSETTVELPSGAVMMTAGLIQQSSAQAINGLPGVMSLPVLGTLFRSRDYQRRETELMIMVTPFIAKPMEPAQVARPDDGFVDAHDGQSILLGRLNRLYGVVGAPPLDGYKGSFGFIVD
ncbi:MAG TPA: type II and III secretion system protein family protein [Beijerinckiaceae bacterium]|nr:type II and III secretion system protein family protein [Beijerinckiaceae bacterium]